VPVPPTRVAIIGAALDLGAGRRGVDMGPSAIRYAGLSERLERAGIEVEDRGNVQAPLAETRETGTESARFLDEILETCTRISSEIEAARGDGLLPLVLGGDHSIAMGSLSGLAASGPGGVLWLDAHGD
jgi:arginase